MDFDEYQQETARTSGDLDEKGWLVNCALGLTGEAGEAADMVKKHIFQGHELEKAALVKELGDQLWYIAKMAEVLGVPLSEVAEANVAKLRDRYPDGFDEKRSRNRDKGLLGDAQAVGATKASMAKVETPEVVEVDGISWVKRSGEWGAGGLYRSLWIALDIEGGKLHRVGPLWVLSSPQLFYGVFDATSVPTVDLPHKALRWAAFRLGSRDGEGGK